MDATAIGAGHMPRGFRWLIAAQFFSGLADNALLIVAMAFMVEQGFAAWWTPLLKFSFTLSYVVLAPAVGAFSDTVPKARLMSWTNGIKLIGASALLLGAHPVLAFAVVGLGASAYAPAKYGLITESLPPGKLVAANGWLEVTVVLSVLLGTGLGGWLVSSSAQALFPAASEFQATLQGVSTRYVWPITLVLLIYSLSALLNFGIPISARPRQDAFKPLSLLKEFRGANLRLWKDPLGGLSLSVTTLFWGAGGVLQFAVFRWADQALGLPLDRAAYLQATVAIGVVLGAALAAHRVSLNRASRVLPWGIALGLLVALTAQLTQWEWALPLLLLSGAVGGVLVVPMNAMLQYRGHRLLTPGRSIAVQGFNENLSVLLMLSLYAALLIAQVPIVVLMTGFGLTLAASMAVLLIASIRIQTRARARASLSLKSAPIRCR